MPKTWKELIFYKLDRLLAIFGLVIIGIYSLFRGEVPSQVAMAVIGALGVYIGGRGAKNEPDKKS